MIDLYRRLRYPVPLPDGRVIALVHGVHDREIDAMLAAHGVDAGVYITAWNPRGVATERATNRDANARLRAELARLCVHVLDVPGASSETDWTPEESFFALGVARATAEELGRTHAQRAVVFVERGAAPIVIDLAP